MCCRKHLCIPPHPGMFNPSHMSNSFHHSILLFFLWHHQLPVGALCFRATMLFLCRDNNREAGKQWNVPHLSCVTQHLLTVLTTSLLSNTCQVHLWRGRLWAVVVVKSCLSSCFCFYRSLKVSSIYSASSRFLSLHYANVWFASASRSTVLTNLEKNIPTTNTQAWKVSYLKGNWLCEGN